MTRAFRSICLALVMCSAAAAPALAQSAVQDSPSAVDVSYNVLSKSDKSWIGFHMSYWQAWRDSDQGSLRWVGELDLTKFDFASVLGLQGGVRYVFKMAEQPKWRPFVQGLVGIERCCGETDLAISPGAGVFYAYNEAFDIIAQIDFRHVNYNGFSDTHQRYSVGVSFPLGAR